MFNIKTSFLRECCKSNSGLHEGMAKTIERAVALVSGNSSKPDLPKISFFHTIFSVFFKSLLLYQLYKVNTEKKFLRSNLRFKLPSLASVIIRPTLRLFNLPSLCQWPFICISLWQLYSLYEILSITILL